MSGELVLVTGASGFVGSHCVKKLQESGYKVRGTVRSLKNSQKVDFLHKLCPDAQHPLELVEADLCDAESWIAAAKECKFVLHTASAPFDLQPKNPDDILKPAIEGTMAVLKAAAEAGTVQRVVITSSTASIEDCGKKDGPFSEEDWSIPDKQATVYNKGKTLAEKAAWDFVKDLPDEKKFDLVVLNPVGIVGPILGSTVTTVAGTFVNLMEKKFPMVPRLHFQFIDILDVAQANITCLTSEEAKGKRIIVWCDSLFYPDIANFLAEEFKPQGYNIPTSVLPNAMLSFASKFDSMLRLVKDTNGSPKSYTTERMKTILGITNPRPLKESIVEMVYSLIEAGLIQKTKQYKGPPAK